MQPTENNIKNRVCGKGRGWVFTPKSFSDLGTADAIKKALSRLEKKGVIRRLAKGLYDYPKTHNKLGQLPAEIDRVAEAIAQKYSIRIQPSGAYAANLLGLIDQVPAKIVFFTDGSSRKYKIGNRDLEFRRTTPKNMKTVGSISGLVIQGLKHIGKDNVTKGMLIKLLLNLMRKILRD